MCVSLSIIEIIDHWVANTQMMAMNPVHSSDQQEFMTCDYLLTMSSTISSPCFN